MRITLAAAAMAMGIGLAVAPPSSAHAAGAAGVLRSTAVETNGAGVEQVHYRRHRHWRHRHWGYGGPSIYLGIPGFYGAYSFYRPHRYRRHYHRPHYYRSYGYYPHYYRW